MYALDKDALICDFAETYGILDMWALPVPLLATLAVGLGPTSRIRRKISGDNLDTNTLLLAMAVDYLALLGWIESGSAQKKKKRPASVVEILRGVTKEEKKKEKNVKKYRSTGDFDRAWAELTRGKKDG
ncbi:MAG: DUF5361 domain-containing protein [Bacteroidales bacterium]|nr:DUF5361 domain-containing protein [Bacteroidales bacterium]